MTIFAEKGLWRAPFDLGTGRAVRSEEKPGKLEVSVPDTVRRKVATPGVVHPALLPQTRSRPKHRIDPRAEVPGQTGHMPQETVNPLVACAEAAAQTALDHLVCFTPGTGILTGQGERPVETLQVGDMVVTRDQGLRAIRWIGHRKVAGEGLLAPIEFLSSGRSKDDEGLLVSPQHRMLFTGHRAHMLFGAPEVLVAAKDLVNGSTVRRRPTQDVTYMHLMFDHHEVIYANGLATESFHATDPVLTGLEDAAREAVFEALPDLRAAANRHVVPARTCLSEAEARNLSAPEAAPTFLE